MSQNGYSSPVNVNELINTNVISRVQAKSMMGLGWEAKSMGAVLMFLLGSVELRSEHAKVTREPKHPQAEEEDELVVVVDSGDESSGEAL